MNVLIAIDHCSVIYYCGTVSDCLMHQVHGLKLWELQVSKMKGDKFIPWNRSLEVQAF